MGGLAALASLAVLWSSQGVFQGGAGPFVAGAFVAFVLLVGVAFDLVGVSATAAAERPFHARASHRRPGAVQSLRLIRHADQVASVCLDLVGDVAGTLAGALGTAVAFRLAGGHAAGLFGAMAVAAIAGMNVGMKAVAKAIAVADPEGVMALVGEFLFFLERIGLPPLWANGGRKGGSDVRG